MSLTFCWELATAGLVIAVGLIGYVIAEQRRHRAKLKRGEISWTCTEKRGACIGNPNSVDRVMLSERDYDALTAEERADLRMPVDPHQMLYPELTQKVPDSTSSVIGRLSRMIDVAGANPKRITDISPGEPKLRG